MRITELFDNGQFVVTAEVGPPKGCHMEHVVEEAKHYLSGITAVNITGGICPITACSKSLINGQCGGAKNGKCEVDPNMDCGWERIYQKLKKLGRLDAMKCPVQLRDYSVEK